MPCLQAGHFRNLITIRLNGATTIFFIMSGLISIGSTAEWQSLLSGTNVVVADCTYTSPFSMQCGYSFN